MNSLKPPINNKEGASRRQLADKNSKDAQDFKNQNEDKKKETPKTELAPPPKIKLDGPPAPPTPEVKDKKPDTFLAPSKEKISLEEKKKKMPFLKGVFFTAISVILIILLAVLGYLLLPKNPLQKLFKHIPLEAVSFVVLNEEENPQTTKGLQNYKELSNNAQEAFSKKLENYGLNPKKIKPFLGKRTALTFLSDNKKLVPLYFFEIKDKKELSNALAVLPAFAADKYKEVSFYANQEQKAILLLDDFLILADRGLAVKIIESYKKERTILKNLFFKKAVRRLKPRDTFLFSYLNAPLLKKYLEEKEETKKYSSFLNEFEGAALAVEGPKIKGFILFDKQVLRNPVFISSTLKSAPAETAFLVNSTNFQKNIEPLLKENDVYLNYLKKLIEETGINLKDTSLALENEFSFFIASDKNKPQYSFISEIKNIEAAKLKLEAIKTLIENYFAKEEPEEETKTLPDGTKATYLKLPAKPPKFKKEIYAKIPLFFLKSNNQEKIAYALFDKKIFVSSSLKILKEMIDLNNGKTKTLNFQKGEPLPQNYHLFIYLNPRLLLETFPNLTKKIPKKTKENLFFAPPFSVKALFNSQGIILEGKTTLP